MIDSQKFKIGSFGSLVKFIGIEPNLPLPKGIFQISESAFEGNETLKTLEMNEEVKFIDTKAFKNCKALESISISRSIVSIESSAFENCEKLSTINLFDLSKITKISNYCFYACHSLKNIEIPQNVNDICWKSFYDCNSLENITFSKNVRIIKTSAFENCSSLDNVDLVDSIQILDEASFKSCTNLINCNMSISLYYIGKSAFENCTKLNRLDIYDRVGFIGKDAFKNCPSLVIHCIENSFAHIYAKDNNIPFEFFTEKEIKEYEEKIKSVDYVKLFWSYKRLTSDTCAIISYKGIESDIIIPSYINNMRVDTIEYACFFGKNCNSIKILDSVTTINDNAFSYCKNLTKLYIPSSVKHIGTSIVDGCDEVVIYGEKDSFVYDYADENDIPFFVINS